MLSSYRKSLSSKLKELLETKDVNTGNRDLLLKYPITLSVIEYPIDFDSIACDLWKFLAFVNLLVDKHLYLFTNV